MTNDPHKADVARCHSEIREAIMKHWDPIGVASVPECADEYDDYVPEIYRMLARGRSPKELFDYLWWLETSCMGLTGTPKAQSKTEAFAERLCKISVSSGAPKDKASESVQAR